MPYIVHVYGPCPEGHPEPLAQGDGSGWDGASYHTPPCETCGDHCEVLTSRRAFETLEEAHERYHEVLYVGGFEPPADDWQHWADEFEVDKHVGPLADGVVVQVEAVTYHALWHAVPWDSGFRGGPYMETDGAQNIAAFNAWQEAQHAA